MTRRRSFRVLAEKKRASIGIGFAIPANLARATLERIAGKPLTSRP
jgi:S1-C subfamily serine protease